MKKRNYVTKPNRQPIGVAKYPTVSERRTQSQNEERYRAEKEAQDKAISDILRAHRDEQRNRTG